MLADFYDNISLYDEDQKGQQTHKIIDSNTIIPTHKEKEILLICKSLGDTFEDIRKFQSEYCLIDIDYLTDDDVYRFILPVFLKYIDDKEELMRFFHDIYRFDIMIDKKTMTSYMMGRLTGLEVIEKTPEGDRVLIDLD